MKRILSIMAVLAGLLAAGCGKDYTVIQAEEKTGDVSADAAPGDREIAAGDLPQDVKDGLILYRQGQNSRAIEFFQKVVAEDNTSWLACYYLGLALAKSEAYQEALRSLRRSLKFAPIDNRDRSLIYVAMGETWEHKGDKGRAKQHYHTALNLYPESPGALEGLRRLAEMSQYTH